MCQRMDQEAFDRLYIESMKGTYTSDNVSQISKDQSGSKSFVLRSNLIYNAISMLRNISSCGLDPDGKSECNNRAVLEKAFSQIPSSFISENEDDDQPMCSTGKAVRAFSSTKQRRKSKRSEQSTTLSQMKTTKANPSDQLSPVPDKRISKSIPHNSKVIHSISSILVFKLEMIM